MAINKKGLPAGRQGFTLIELVVVTVIFGILLTVGTNIFFQVVMSANKASTEADLRQNASFVMETISREVRKAQCIDYTGGLMLYKNSDCPLNGTPTSFTISGINILKDGVEISSPKADFTNSTFTGDNKTATVTLDVRAAGRWDYTGKIVEQQTITVRNAMY